MKRYIAVAAALALAGCNTTVDHSGLIPAVVAGTRTACSFVPTANTIAAIFAKANPALATADAVVTAVCSAVTGPGKSNPAVDGVPIKGAFVNQ